MSTMQDTGCRRIYVCQRHRIHVLLGLRVQASAAAAYDLPQTSHSVAAGNALMHANLRTYVLQTITGNNHTVFDMSYCTCAFIIS